MDVQNSKYVWNFHQPNLRILREDLKPFLKHFDMFGDSKLTILAKFSHVFFDILPSLLNDEKKASQLWSAETRLCPCLDAISQDLGEFPLLHRTRTNDMKLYMDHFGA